MRIEPKTGNDPNVPHYPQIGAYHRALADHMRTKRMHDRVILRAQENFAAQFKDPKTPR